VEEAEYMQIANSIPNEWYTAVEAKEITAKIFYDIMISTAMRSNIVIKDKNDLQQLLNILAEERNVPVAEVTQDVQNIALTVGAVRLFREKYSEIAEQFPLDEYSNPIYPSKFLGKILGIDTAVAEEILNGVLKEYSIYLVSTEPSEQR